MPKTYTPVLNLPRPGTGADLVSEGDDIIRELTDRLDTVIGPPKGTAGGDLGGSYPNPQVVTINGKAVSAVVFNTDARLTDSRPPSGAAGGDLAGTYPSPVLSTLNGRSVSSVVFTDDTRLSTPAAHGASHSGAGGSDPIPGVVRQVRVVQNANVDIANPGTGYDNVGLAAGNRVLLIGQTDATQNGVWVWNGAAVPLTRPADFAAGAPFMAGQQVYATSGSAYINRLLTFATGGTVGTSAVVIFSTERQSGPQPVISLPVAPYVYPGMEVYLSVDQAASYSGPYLWHLRYRTTNNDGSANTQASKWEVVNRPFGLRKLASNQVSTSSNAYSAMGGDSVTIPYTGTYHVHAWVCVLAGSQVNAEPIAMVGKNGSSILTMDTVAGGTGSIGVSDIAFHSATAVFTANAGDVIAWYMRSFNSDGQGFAERALEVTPMRLT